MKCETVRVVADTHTGFKVINKSDFNSKEHKLFGKKQRAKKTDTGQDGGNTQSATISLI